MALVLAFFGLVALVVWLYCLLDVATTPGSAIRTFPKAGWVALIAATFIFGAVAWLLFGRPQSETSDAERTAGPNARPANTQPGPPQGTWPSPTDRPPPPGRRGPVGPDDDPEFLRRLGRRRRDDDPDDPDS